MASSNLNSSSASKDDSYDSSQGLSLLLSSTAFQKLRKKKYVSEWNDSSARHVYGAFRVKRYHVDLNHIFCPTLKKPSDYHEYTLDAIAANDDKTWEDFRQRIQGFLDVFDEDAYCIGEGPTDQKTLLAGIQAMRRKNKLKSEKSLCVHLNVYITMVFDNIEYLQGCHKKNKSPPKSFYQQHVEILMKVFNYVEPYITTLRYFGQEEYEFSVDDHTYKPKPDIFLVDGIKTIVAVIEVKNIDKRMNPQHGDQPDATRKTDKSEFISTSLQVPSSPDVGPPPVKKAKLVEVLDDNQPPASGPSSPHDVESYDNKPDTSDSSTSPHNSESDRDSGNDSDDVECESDIFDKAECAIEAAKKADLPTFVRTLDFQEKRSIRCILPQLFAEMLAYSHHEQNWFFPMTLYENFRLGLAVSNFKVRFVTLVIKDNGKKIAMPTAADIQKDINVRPYIYVTDELNLFKKDDLTQFFRVLFAISKHSAG